jgi:uncharacterized UPF0160 family protein
MLLPCGAQPDKHMKIITHNGVFHADEVVACATLCLVFDGHCEIERSRNPEVIAKADVAVDVGGGAFDHHHHDSHDHHHPEGVKMASAGLVWEAYGMKAVAEVVRDFSVEVPASTLPAIAERLRKEMMLQVDAVDNGDRRASPEIPGASFSNVISEFNPKWPEEMNEESSNTAFYKALIFAYDHLRRVILRIAGEEVARDIVLQHADKAVDGIVQLPEFIPWQEALAGNPEIRAVVWPREDQTFGCQMVPVAPRSFKTFRQLPERWAGKTEEALKDTDAPEGTVFVHLKRWFGVAKTLEGALELAKAAEQVPPPAEVHLDRIEVTENGQSLQGLMRDDTQDAPLRVLYGGHEWTFLDRGGFIKNRVYYSR